MYSQNVKKAYNIYIERKKKKKKTMVSPLNGINVIMLLRELFLQ